jgi:hypothetical protein
MWRGPAVKRLAPEQALRLAGAVMAMLGVAWGSAGHGPAASCSAMAVRLGLVGLVEYGAWACLPAGRPAHETPHNIVIFS